MSTIKVNRIENTATTDGGIDIDSSGRVGIGESSPAANLEITPGTGAGTLLLNHASGSTTDGALNIEVNSSGAFYETRKTGGLGHIWYAAGVERMRIDSSGRLLIGTSSTISVNTQNSPVQVEGTTAETSRISVINRGNDASGSGIQIAKSRGTAPAVVQQNDQVGGIFFCAADGSDFNGQAARIECYIDALPGGNDTPGRLTFSTTPDQTDSPVERLRIDSSGRVLLGTTTEGEATADNLTIADSGHCGITLRSGTSSVGTIFFSDGTSGGAEYQGYVQYDHSANYLKWATAGTERMRIDSSGRLLVGTSASRDSGNINQPYIQREGTSVSTSTLAIVRNSNDSGPSVVALSKSRGTSVGSNTLVQNGDALGAIYFSGADGSDLNNVGALIQAEVDGGPGTNDMPGRLVFSTTANGASSPTERMRITSGGSLLLASRTSDDLAGAGTLFQDSSGGTSPVYLYFKKTFSGTRDAIDFRHSGTQVGSITFSNSNTAYNTSSDYRLKENIVDLTGAIARVNQLSPRRFNFIGESDTVDGFVAHEAQAVVPEAVHGTHNGVEVWDSDDDLPDGVSVGDSKLDENENTIPKYQGIDQSKLVPLLTAALQEAIAKIETLETKVAALEAG